MPNRSRPASGKEPPMTPSWILPIVTALMLAASVSAHAATIQITMENLVISPAEASAKIGDTIEWINKDVVAHAATARNGDWDVTLPLEKTGCHCRKLNQASEVESGDALG